MKIIYSYSYCSKYVVAYNFLLCLLSPDWPSLTSNCIFESIKRYCEGNDFTTRLLTLAIIQKTWDKVPFGPLVLSFLVILGCQPFPYKPFSHVWKEKLHSAKNLTTWGWVNNKNSKFWVNCPFNKIQKFSTISKMLLHHCFEVFRSVSASLCPWRTKASAMTVLSQVSPLSFLLECARHGGPDRSRRCETSLPGHSTHATAAGYCATQCVCAVEGMSRSLWPLYSVDPPLFSLKWTMSIFRKIQYDRKCAWQCLRVFLGCF